MLRSFIDEIAERLDEEIVVVPSNPSSLDRQGHLFRVLDEGQSSGRILSNWLPTRTRLAMAFGTMPADDPHGVVVGPAEGRALIDGQAPPR